MQWADVDEYHSKYAVVGRQHPALQGHEESESNFILLLKLRSHDQSVSPILYKLKSFE